MQKHIRTGISGISRVASGPIYVEALNPYFGYFYTITKSLHKSRTKYQKIELVETKEFGKVLLLDDITQVAEKNDCDYHEPMVHPALCCHPHPQSVLIIGGGDGGIAREVLKYFSVKRLEIAELDGEVIDFSRKYLSSIHGGCFDDPRTHINIVDGRKYTEEHRGEFDVIIMDMTDPFGPSKMLYTREFFRNVKRALKNTNGIFVMHSESPVTRPSAYSCIQKTLSSVFPNVNPFYLYIQMYAVLWSITLSSEAINTGSVKPVVIDRRLARSSIRDLQVYSGQTHSSMQVAFPYISQISKRSARIISDARPDFPDNFLS